MEEKAGNLSQARLAAAIVLRTTCSCGKELRQISYLLFVSQGIPSWPGMVAYTTRGCRERCASFGHDRNPFTALSQILIMVRWHLPVIAYLCPG